MWGFQKLRIFSESATKKVIVDLVRTLIIPDLQTLITDGSQNPVYFPFRPFLAKYGLLSNKTGVLRLENDNFSIYLYKKDEISDSNGTKNFTIWRNAGSDSVPTQRLPKN